MGIIKCSDYIHKGVSMGIFLSTHGKGCGWRGKLKPSTTSLTIHSILAFSWPLIDRDTLFRCLATATDQHPSYFTSSHIHEYVMCQRSRQRNDQIRKPKPRFMPAPAADIICYYSNHLNSVRDDCNASQPT